MDSNLNPRKEEHVQAFKELDLNNSGHISYEMLEKFVRVVLDENNEHGEHFENALLLYKKPNRLVTLEEFVNCLYLIHAYF